MGREFELKYRANPNILEEIRGKYQDFTEIQMVTAYYDTWSRSLSDRRWMLRRRMENGRSVCTLKTPLPDGSRGEWETECGSVSEAVDILCKLGAPEELRAIAAQGLYEICAARFTRLALEVSLPGASAELALDRGSFLGNGQEQPFAELEVELKSGSEEAVYAFAESLAKEYCLTPEPRSKVQRALALTESGTPRRT